MINSVRIQRFKNLNNLVVNEFAKLNLIVGRNNVGKTALLEALYLWANKAELWAIWNLLDNRGEGLGTINPNDDKEEVYLESISSLFSDFLIDFQPDNALSVNVNFKHENSSELTLRVVPYRNESSLFADGSLSRQRILQANELEAGDYSIGIERVFEQKTTLFTHLRPSVRMVAQSPNARFVAANKLSSSLLAKLWDAIVLSPKEELVLEALRIVEPKLERIVFIDDKRGKRKPIAKLTDSPKTFPLSGMGDGINRILDIALALVNAENGIVLIDEFENGLHHSVQLRIWSFIHRVAVQYNIQVFATTHSNDCVLHFANAFNQLYSKIDYKYFRLDNHRNDLEVVEYPDDLLTVAVESNIETR